MKANNKHSRLLALFVALSVAGTGSAWAGGDYKHYRHHDHKHYSHKYDHHAKHRHHGRHHHDYGKRHKDDDDGEKLLIGLIIGGIIGYAINQSQQAELARDNYYAPRYEQTRDPYYRDRYRDDYRY